MTHSPRTPASWSDWKLTTTVRLRLRVTVNVVLALASILGATESLTKENRMNE